VHLYLSYALCLLLGHEERDSACRKFTATIHGDFLISFIPFIPEKKAG